jgi:hypothetical protein
MHSSAFVSYICPPFIFIFAVVDTLVFRGAITRCFCAVAAILSGGNYSQLSFGIVQAIPVFMVDDGAYGIVHNLAVHINNFAALDSARIEIAAATFDSLPIVFGQPVVIFGVNDCVFAFGKFYFAKRETPAVLSIQNGKQYAQAHDTIRNRRIEWDISHLKFKI